MGQRPWSLLRITFNLLCLKPFLHFLHNTPYKSIRHFFCNSANIPDIYNPATSLSFSSSLHTYLTMEPLDNLFLKINELKSLNRNRGKYRLRKDFQALIDDIGQLIEICTIPSQTLNISSSSSDEPIIPLSVNNSPEVSLCSSPPVTPSSENREYAEDSWQVPKTTLRRERRRERQRPEGNVNNKDKNGVPKGKKENQSQRQTEALLIHKSQGDHKDYAAALKKARVAVDAKSSGIEIKKVRWAKNGGLLVECTRNASALREKLTPVLEEGYSIRHLIPKAKICITDLDATADEEDIRSALSLLHVNPNHITLRKLRGGRLMASMWVPLPESTKLTELKTLRIGWTMCKIRLGDGSRRCRKCLAEGHSTSGCSSTMDYRDLCYNCSQKGHKAASCTASPHCSPCQTRNKQYNHAMRATCRSNV